MTNKCRKAKEKWAEEQANLVESTFETNNARKVFKTIKNLTEQRCRQINVIEDKNGDLLPWSNDIAERRKEYCEELYKHKAEVDQNVLDEDMETKGQKEDKESEILRLEVEIAVRSLKKNKSPRADNISAELIQSGGTITENGTSEQEIRNRIGTATSAMVRLDTVWSLKGIRLKN